MELISDVFSGMLNVESAVIVISSIENAGTAEVVDVVVLFTNRNANNILGWLSQAVSDQDPNVQLDVLLKGDCFETQLVPLSRL